MGVATMDQPTTAEYRMRMDAADALANPVFRTYHPRPGRIFVTKPRGVEFRSKGGLHVPDQAHARWAEMASEALVLRVGTGCAPEIVPGTRVILAEFAGKPIVDLVTGSLTVIWIIGDGDVMAVRTDAPDADVVRAVEGADAPSA